MAKDKKKKQEDGKKPRFATGRRAWDKVSKAIKYDEYRSVWNKVGIASGLMIVLVGGTVGYYTWNTPLDRAEDTATTEYEDVTKELRNEVSKEVGFELPTKEEVQSFVSKLEKRNGDLLPMGRYNAIKEEYGEKVADCYVGGFLVSTGMSEDDKEQVTRNIRAMYDKNGLVGMPKRVVFNEPFGKLESKGTQMGVTATDYFVDTKGYDKIKGWSIGYPAVQPSGFSGMDGDKNNEDIREKYKGKSLVSFFAFADEDKDTEEVINELSGLSVTINGKQAKPAGTLVKNMGREVDMDLKAVPFLLDSDSKTEAKGKKLLKGGLVTVVYEIDNEAVYKDEAALQDNEVDKAKMKIEDKEYDLVRNVADFKDDPYMNYSVRG
ncbi:hypothetical protein [Bacillus cereus]|uniref:hypothetical protein n=1 Tax=Bacillus cereus TaxID=1396 RepID=UPI001C8C62B9|nr:hypothetical protein [Bacillus cereus]MBX9158404.1 hypothetical protein [Bacillus cereus]